MDPLTAIGLASNIISFIDFGAKVVTGAAEIYGSSGDSTEANRSYEAVATEMRHFACKLQPPDDSKLVGDEKALCQLVSECNSVANLTLQLLAKMKPKDGKSKGSSLRAGWKTMWYDGDRRKLQERLSNCRAQLNLHLTHLASSETKSKLDAIIASVRKDSSKIDQVSGQVEQIRKGYMVSSLSSEAQAQIQSLLNLSENVREVTIQQRILKDLAYEGMYGRFDAVDEAHYKTFRWFFNDTSDDSDEYYESDYESDTDDSDNTESDDNLRLSAPLSTASKVTSRNHDQVFGDRNDSNDDDNNDSQRDVMTEDNESNPTNNHGNGFDLIDDNTTQDTVSQDSESSDGHSTQASTKSELENPARQIAKDRLITWLSSGNGIFHISGKLGCGKSTLMKFLCQHRRTKSILKGWAGSRTLVFASFFFWNPGSVMQRTLAGLVRSVLHDVLTSCPHFIRQTLPKAWEQADTTASQAITEIHFSDKEIRRGFLQLIRDPGVYEKHAFCFFIDGLDEYEGTHQDDARSLVDTLGNWTAFAPDHVKLCVSSREYNVFMNAFSATKRIQIHDLTRSDMQKYVDDKLGHMDDSDNKTSLASSIVANSHGIFLWVVLVVKRIREQMENGYSFKALLKEVDSLPRELNDLFAHILDSLAETDLKTAYMTFSMAMELEPYFRLSLSLLAYFFLDEYSDDSVFAMQPEFGQCQGKWSDEVMKERVTLAHKRLNGCCLGLVEAVSQGSEPIMLMVRFTHRSVPEFLSSRIRKQNMLEVLNGFRSTDCITSLTLAGMIVYPKCMLADTTGNLVDQLIQLRHQAGLDTSPYTFLEAYAHSLYLANLNSTFKFPVEVERVDSIRISSSICHKNVRITTHLGNTCCNRRIRETRALSPMHPIYTAAMYGPFGYVQWKLSHDPAVDSTLALDLVLICIVQSEVAASTTEILKAVTALVDRGLSHSTKTDILFLYHFDHDPDNLEEHRSGMVSVWVNLLLMCVYSKVWSGHHPQRLFRLGYILQRYLEDGADPYFEIRLTEAPIESLEQNSTGDSHERSASPKHWQFRLVLGCDRQKVSLRFTESLESNQSGWTFTAGSLAEYLKIFKFENEERLLDLVETNIMEMKKKRGEGTAEGDELQLNGEKVTIETLPPEDPRPATSLRLHITVYVSLITMGIVLAVIFGRIL